MAPRKPNKPALTREQIVEAALELIDENGLEGHSMRHLGAHLGVDPSSIYYYVPSKVDLYNLIVDEIMDGMDASFDDASAPFEERFVAAANEYRRTLLVHPKAMPLVSARSLRTQRQLRGVELLLVILSDAGFEPTEALAAVNIFGMTVLGMVNAYAAHITDSEYHGSDDEFEELPPSEFPLVTRVLAEATYLGFDAEFELAMRALANGLLALHESGALDTPAQGGEARCS